jgi:hypothetical protein
VRGRSRVEEVALIAVIGPAAHDLVPAFAAYYTSIGVTEFRIAVHFPPGTDAAVRTRLLDVCDQALGPIDVVSDGPWLVETNPRLRDRLRALASADWHVIADSDEFQFHAAGVGGTIEACDASGVPFATGLFLDRLPSGDELPAAARSPEELDGAFPLGSFLTAELLDGDPRKITVAHRDVDVDSPGNHFTTSHAGVKHPAPAPVHHFKWRAGVREYLASRVRQFEGRPEPSEIGVRGEAMRALEMISDRPPLRTFAASLRELPAGWDRMAGPLWRYWQVDRSRR